MSNEQDWIDRMVEAQHECPDETRKIVLPKYCVPLTGTSSGGDDKCDHDYPPNAAEETPEHATWTCSKCGMRRTYEVFQ